MLLQSRQNSASIQFWILAIFLTVVFLAGGASRIDAQSLLILRPLSVVACAIALVTLSRKHIAEYRWLLIGVVAVFILILLQTIPLPPAIWHNLPGRDPIIQVDKIAGLGEMWRPLALVPMNAWHSLASLFVPLAVLMLGIQLNRDDLFRMLPVVLILGGLSGLFGVMQVIGNPQGPLYLYRYTNNGSAVGLFANRNHAALLLALIAPMLSVYMSISSGTVDQQRMRQMVAIGSAIVLIPLILVTGSRSGLLIALLGLLAAALLYRRPTAARTVRRGGTRFAINPVIALSALAVFCLGLLTMFLSRATAIERLFEQSSVEDARGQYWSVVVDMVWKYFPFGSGAGSFVESFQIDEPDRLITSTYLNHAHNDWIEVVLTMGLPAIVLLVTAAAFFGRNAYALWRHKDADRRAVKFGKLASLMLVMIAIASITDYPLRTPTMLSLTALVVLWLLAFKHAPSATLPSNASNGSN